MGDLKTMRRNELIEKWEEKDLIAIKTQKERVHIVWHDEKYGMRICRPSMIKVGTQRRDEREWEIVDSCSTYAQYEEKVEEIDRTVCKDCLSHMLKNT